MSQITLYNHQLGNEVRFQMIFFVSIQIDGQDVLALVSKGLETK